MVVHQKLGSGFYEAVYQEALEIELTRNNIPFISNVKLNIQYDNLKLMKYYRADIICYNSIILELKASTVMVKEQERQLLNYLKATNYRLGILINFGQPSLIYKRLINL